MPEFLRLTPLGPGWGWGSRIIEIVVRALSLLILGPLMLLYAGLDRLFSKIWNS